MARPTQNTVDYFSHDCNHKQTMYILESRYKNDGYAFWFKLLESLGSAPNHFLDLNDEIACEFLAAKTNLNWSSCDEILTLLAKINAICPDLWAKKIVWCQKFVDRMAGVYAKRKRELPSKPSFCDGNVSIVSVSVTETPQSKVNESRVNKIKEKSPADFEKSADDELPFADKSGLVQVEKVKPKSKKIKADKIPKESNPNAWAIWVDVNREFGRVEPFSSGKDTRAAKNILTQIKDPEKYADILRQFLSDDDKFLMQNGHSISFLTSKINKYLNKQYQPLDTYDFSPEEEAYIYAMEERIAKEEAEKAKQQKE
jgi:hypothetical protein